VSRSGEKLASEEWNFNRTALHDDQIEECWAYEFARECAELIDLISRWRDQVPTKEFSAYLRASGGVVTPFIQVGNEVFLIHPGAYYIFPGWPKSPYRAISPGQRRSWLKEVQTREERFLVTNELEARPSEYGLRGTGDKSAWKRFLRSLRENTMANRFRAFRTDLTELVMFLLDWRLSDRQILALISKWLKQNRPQTLSKRTAHVGAGDPTRVKRKQLEQLGKYRIVRANGGNWRNPGGRQLFTDQSHWIKCRKLVEEIITGFRPGPGSILLA
jgi:hypothetical protein